MLFRTQSYLACSRQSVRSVYFRILKILIICLFFNFNPHTPDRFTLRNGRVRVNLLVTAMTT